VAFRNRAAITGALAAFAVFALVGCSDDNRNATGDGSTAGASISAGEAEELLRGVVLAPEDLGEGMREASARVQTNEELAHARADTAFALDQYASWGQALAYTVHYDAEGAQELVDTGAFTRVSNTATAFEDEAGARMQLAYVHGQSDERLANAVTNDGAGTRIVDAQVTKDMAFPSKGDESFAWRISGKATFEGGTTLNFIADTVFVRAGNISG
jgi:hypothetical protein